MSTIINKTIQGLNWNFKSQITTQGINFLVALLLMRWLDPADFGKFAMVLIIVIFLQILRSAGFTVAIIQMVKISKIALSTAFWCQSFLAIIFGALLFFSGTILNSFYEETVLDQISFWLSIDFVIGTLGIVPTTLLRKELKFKTLFKIQLVAIIASSICGIVMAINGLSFYSLIGKYMSFSLLNSVGTFLAVKWKPSFQFSIKELKKLLDLGLPDTGNHLLSYIVRNTDDFFIGRVIGATSLGFYNRAYAIMLLPMFNITSVLEVVLFSTWSKMQDDLQGIKIMFIKVSGIIALISFPIMTLLALFTTPIISILFGESWLPMSRTLSILSIIGMFQSVSSLIGLIFIVSNKTKLFFKINIVSSLITIGLVIWSVYSFKSIEITAFTYGVASILLLYPSYFFASKILSGTMIELIKPIIYPLIFSIIVGIVGWGIYEFSLIENLYLKLFFSFFTAMLIYIILCLKFKPPAVTNLIKATSKYFAL